MATRRAVRLRLLDILDAIRGIEETLGGLDFARYQSVWHLRRATERGIEIISEASRHIPQDLKQKYPAVPWNEIAGIGNVLRHDYQHVADEIVWNVTRRHLKTLRHAIEALLPLVPDNDR